ncbi:mitochondrial carrier domain-containing protein [Melanogaster broomeanus]|nr:mitochondrial carrier domain-containing protein [Melanogaster broomeanus]
MAAERKPTFAQSLIAGGAADTVKTRLQSAQGFLKAGGFRGIYKGVGSVVVGSAPGAAIFFSTYEMAKQSLPLHGQLAPLNHMISASIGEIAACLVRVPTEVIKTRTQTSSYGSAATTSVAAAKIVLRHEGIKGFYRGFGTTIMREIPFTSLQFPLYELLKLRLSLALGARPLRAPEAAICGSIAGGVAAALTTPLDVLKTRVMLDMRVCTRPSVPSSHIDPSFPNIQNESQIPSLLARFQQIRTNEGPRALFAGVVPRTLWISAGGAVFLGVYEWVVGGLVGS